MSDALALEHLLDDVQEIALEIGRKFTDEDIVNGEKTWGVDFKAAALHFIDTYNGDFQFMVDVKAKRVLGLPISLGMMRGALNVLRASVTDESPGDKKVREVPQVCFTCGYEARNMEELLRHKEREHGQVPKGSETASTVRGHLENCDGNHPDTQSCEARILVLINGPQQEVIENQSNVMKLDLSSLPDGRYAVPDLAGKHDFVFLMVRRVTRSHRRDRRYTYGQRVVGNEWIEAGTIEVKEWSSDAKELVGEQRPGETYRGKHEVQLRAVIAAPKPWSLLFGQQIGRCGICGKTLTDEVSRAIGLGPECEKKEDYFNKRPPDYTVYCPASGHRGKVVFQIGAVKDRRFRYTCTDASCKHQWDYQFKDEEVA